MNILFVLYGDFTSNSVHPLALYANEFHTLGHSCAVAVPNNLETVQQCPNAFFRPLLYSDVLNNPEAVFPDGRCADVIHAWTPREIVRHFVTSYMVKRPTPLIVYLEDHESWIAYRALGLEEATVVQQTEQNISEHLPDALSHPFRYDSFIGLADAVVVIQDKLKIEAPSWVYCETVMPCVDLKFFSPRVAKLKLRKKYGIAKNERVIVYPGGLNGFTKPAIETLCRAVCLINKKGYPCKLLRTGPFPLDFIDQLPPEATVLINDLGVLPRSELPNLLALADVFVQPGKIDPFEDLRLPGKLPEFLAMGRPVVMPNVNIAHLFEDGVNAVLTDTGSAEEIATKCIELFSNPQQADKIGQAGRLFAEKYFDAKLQAEQMANVYKIACEKFDPIIATEMWQVEDENMPVTLLLARKLKLLADKSSSETGEILKEYAQYIELIQRRVSGLEVGITSREEQLASLANAVKDKEVHIGNLDRFLKEREGQIASLNQTVVDRNQTIIERNQTVAECNQTIIERNQTVDECKQTIIERNQTVAECKQTIIERNQTVAARDAQITELAQAVHDKEVHIGNLNRILREREGLVNKYLQDVIEMRGSTSWRITAPLRFVSSKTKNIISVIKLLPRLILFGGGITDSTKKAWQIFSEEGWIGVKRRILFVADRREVIRPADNNTLPEVDRNDYSEWVRRYDTLVEADRKKIKSKIASFQNTPLISVVMPVYNAPIAFLDEAIQSVRNQLYPNWELCIADDASTDKAIYSLLERHAKEDSRIKVVFRKQNGHISAASNSALEIVTGEWVALLDHDDCLAEHALFWVVDALNEHPDTQLIYSDEDKIDTVGKRLDPYFKCDWNIDLFYSHNLITHLAVYRTDILNDINGFRLGLEGSQDYDLALRYIECISPKQIHHIPRVLYHWRVHAESTAQSSDAKPYAMLAGERALNEHFQREKINAKVELIGFGYRVHYDLPKSLPLVSLIIPTRNGLELIRNCIESILNKTTYPNYEILIVDNNSDDPETLKYFDDLKAEKRVRVVRDNRVFNYSALNNAAAKLARGDVLGLLNNDLEVISPDWLSEMVSIALQQEVGAVGARLWYPNETLQHGGVILGVGGWAGHAHKGFPNWHPGYLGRMALISSFSAVTGACLVVRKKLYEKLGGLNEIDLQIACNDVDFCLRLREAGYRNVFTPYAELYHHESATRGFEDTPEKQARFSKEVQYMKQRWGETLFNADPAYSSNLTLDYEDFSLAWPPRINSI